MPEEPQLETVAVNESDKETGDMKFNQPNLIVIKLGGNVQSKESIQWLAADLQKISALGYSPILVHGGGSSIDASLIESGIKPKKINGLRVTDEPTMAVVQKVLDQINLNLCAQLEKAGVKACSFDSSSQVLQPIPTAGPGESDLGYVGTVGSIDIAALQASIDKGMIPLITPIGTNDQGKLYNINADEAASAVATSLKAKALIFLSDVAGVLVPDSNGQLTSLAKVNPDQWQILVNDGTVSGGMIPKLETAFKAANCGVDCVQIVDGTQNDSIYKSITTPGSIGTLITA